MLKLFRSVYTVYAYTEFICLTTGGNTKDFTTKTTVKHSAEQGRQGFALWSSDYWKFTQVYIHSEP